MTAAALLFSIAIGAFVTSEIIFIKEVGFGTAVAVLIDATIIRALLVPSLMEMLGQVELVGAGAAAPAARPDRPQRGLSNHQSAASDWMAKVAQRALDGEARDGDFVVFLIGMRINKPLKVHALGVPDRPRDAADDQGARGPPREGHR